MNIRNTQGMEAVQELAHTIEQEVPNLAVTVLSKPDFYVGQKNALPGIEIAVSGDSNVKYAVCLDNGKWKVFFPNQRRRHLEGDASKGPGDIARFIAKDLATAGAAIKEPEPPEWAAVRNESGRSARIKLHESNLNRITFKDVRKALDKLQTDGHLNNALHEITALCSYVGNHIANTDPDVKDNKLTVLERKIVARAVLAHIAGQFGYQPEDLR